MKNKSLFIVIGILLAVAVVGALVYYFTKPAPVTKTTATDTKETTGLSSMMSNTNLSGLAGLIGLI